MRAGVQEFPGKFDNGLARFFGYADLIQFFGACQGENKFQEEAVFGHAVATITLTCR